MIKLIIGTLLLSGAFLAETRAAPLPMAFAVYCIDHIDLCPTVGPKKVAHNQKLSALAARIQAKVNRDIAPRHESIDVWNDNVSQGDCDDYVMTKRKALIKAGVPATAMTVRVGRVRGETHVVLVLNTSRGKIILDNLRSKIYFEGFR